jgi:hypothetical protein
MPLPSQGHYGFPSFLAVDWFCLFIYLWVLTFPTNPLNCSEKVSRSWSAGGISRITVNKGNNKITELRTILQRESQNSSVYKQTKSVNNICLSMCDVKVFLTFTSLSLVLLLTTVLPVLFKYCYKYCYSDSRKRSWCAGGISRIIVKRHELSFLVRWWYQSYYC